ncbi:hypothetical protein B0H19DRAFT_1384685 [Mycena capillaripes]|nr:hypothetical protein B0H19DRAFT_1384685 [Mycena capillaripes]
MRYTVDSQEFDSSWDLTARISSQTGISLFLYGIYINLFVLTLHIVSRRQRALGMKFLIVTSCVMAVLGTMQMAIILAETVITAQFIPKLVQGQVLTQPDSISRLLAAQNVTFAINVLVGDCFFLYRCYVIWGCQRRIIIPPALLMLSTFTGRILWIRRAASHIGLNSAFRNRYNTAIGIILESGAIYCFAAILLVISFTLDVDIYFLVFGIGQQLINIIPMFTLVYIGLNNTVYNLPAEHKPAQVLVIRKEAFEGTYV